MFIPRDVPTEMYGPYMEGVRAGRLRDEDSGYQGEIDNLMNKSGDTGLMKYRLMELEQKQQFFRRGFEDGRASRAMLKGGI